MPKNSKFAATARLIREGDIAQMERVITKWPPLGTQVEVFDAFLPHFLIPGSEKESHAVVQGRSRRARLASSALLLCLDSSTPAQRRVNLSERIVDNLEMILWWQMELHAVNHPGHLPPTAKGAAIMTILLPLYQYTQDIGQALLNLPSAIELIALALASGCLTRFLTSKPSDHYLSFLFLVASLLNGMDSNGMVLETISKRGTSSVKDFVSTILGIAVFLSGHVFHDSDHEEVFRTLTAFHDVLAELSIDPQFCKELRKQKYIEHFALVLGNISNKNPVCRPYTAAYAIEAFHWIAKYQPRRVRKSLLFEFIRGGGLSIIILAVEKYDVEELNTKEVLWSFLGYTSSKQMRQLVKEDLDHIEDQTVPHRKGLPKFGTQAPPRSYQRWTDFATSFEARLPEEEFPAEFPNPTRQHTFCNNLNHFDVTVAPERGAAIRSCSRCHSVAYCCSSCQYEDWSRVHRFECHSLSADNQELLRDGLRITRVMAHNFYFVARHFISIPEQAKNQMAPYSCDLKGGKVIYIDHDVEHPGKRFDIVTVEEYRHAATGRKPWSPARFDAVLEFLRSHDNAQLVAFVLPCWDQRLHILCVVMGESKLVTALAQIEYGESFF
ncbi:hypothetical protein BKA70DRAFT_1564403 [Coprinopsis sp. MPI-PUGE-AT-0042]|nr:hypothetical protein BKA70DRAFT_1564403 [Coprinopsis sp. MPI-PUGE-AT-0042]